MAVGRLLQLACGRPSRAQHVKLGLTDEAQVNLHDVVQELRPRQKVSSAALYTQPRRRSRGCLSARDSGSQFLTWRSPSPGAPSSPARQVQRSSILKTALQRGKSEELHGIRLDLAKREQPGEDPGSSSCIICAVSHVKLCTVVPLKLR